MAASNQAISLAPDTIWPYLYKILNYWGWRGDAGESRAVLEALPESPRDWIPWVWYWQEMYEGRYREALGRLESQSDGWIRTKMWARPTALYAALAYEMLGDEGAAAASYEAARQLLETEVAASPEDPRMRSSLGIVYAAQGRREDAIREGEFACELLPQSKDGFYYIAYAIDLAHIYTILGESHEALVQLEHLLANPSFLSAPFLRMDPRWDPLNADPAFSALLDRYPVDP
jgi:tetratricopeptide (TPR) repeat protein